MASKAQSGIARRAALRLALAGCLALSLPLPGSLAATNKANEKLVHQAANRFLDIVRNGAHRADFEKALNDYTSMQSMALFALGKHRRKLEPPRQQLYIEQFNEMILKALAKHGRKLGGRAFVVTRSFDDIVQGYIQHNLDRTTKVEFRVRKGRITDVRVQGLWLAITLRTSFDQLITDNGGKVDAVFDYLGKGEVP